MRKRGSGAPFQQMGRLLMKKSFSQVTLLAIRAARQYMKIGMRESEARQLIESALTAAGLKGGSALTLFGGEFA